MINKDLLEILACPQSHQPLSEAKRDVLDAINGRINAGTQKNVGGAVVKEPLTSGLIRQDGKIVYPIRDEIPVLLIDEGLATGK